jgi:alginate O-acetyltransferase complex protein AlgI
MVFSSALFVYGFIPVFFSIYFLARPTQRNVVILIASTLFYFAGAGRVIVALLVSVWLNQWLAKRLAGPDRPHRKQLLMLGILLNLSALVYYKYTIFGWTLANHAANAFNMSLGVAPQILLPIGISFFTFQAISYLLDVYWQHVEPAASYFEFAVYHTLFPQLIAGPIVRYAEIRQALQSRPIELSRLSEGAYRFCIGFTKKIILADNLGSVADRIIQLPSTELTAGHAWLGIICYTLQIYYDFSGYSDMAIGLGKLLGFDFPENFNQPYRSASITEFWRRWHMTLSRWFRDYVYIPLGGNRRGPLRTYANLWIVFALCGLWHGAGLNFLVWGLYHGFLLVGERIAQRSFGWRPRGPLAVAATLVLLMVGWVFFRIEDFGTAIHYLRAMFFAGQATTVYFPVTYYLTADVMTYLAVGAFFALAPLERIYGLRVERAGVFAGQLCFAVALFGLSAMQLAANSFNPFIYFRF